MRETRILFFDDEVFILDMFKDLFSKTDYEIICINDSTDCPSYRMQEDSCTRINPCADIIITDFKMPQLNGIELLEYQSQKGCKIDIRNKAIITGFLDEIHMDAIYKTGYAYFLKPFKFSQISGWLKECDERIDLSQPLSPF